MFQKQQLQPEHGDSENTQASNADAVQPTTNMIGSNHANHLQPHLNNFPHDDYKFLVILIVAITAFLLMAIIVALVAMNP